jgi:poly(A) polymerase/tRNA nucleotidyltransferase (CCA-adding enzyme)
MELPEYVKKVALRLYHNGHEAWVVGGSVRDILIGRPAYDHDIATDATPQEVMKLFRRTIPTGVKHGTVTVLSKGEAIEVTTFRSDGKYSDARHPDSVTYAKTILEDLSRRDFTINGIAYNPINDTLVDPYGGIQDIQKRVIRTIGDPVERFNEDGLRPYRACRFAAQLGFSIENNTSRAIGASLKRAGEVSVERIRDEFIKIIQSDKPSTGIELLRTSGLLELFLPEILTGFGINQNVYHRFDIYYHNLYTCDAADSGDYRIRLAALFHDIGKYYAKREIEGKHKGKKSVFYNHEIIGAGITKRIMRRLRFSNNDIKVVNHLIRNHMFHYTYLWTDGAVRRFIRKVGLDNLDSLFELRRADRIGNGLKRGESKAVENLKVRIDKIIEQENAITVKDLALNGHDVMGEFNLKPGPIIGKILNHLLEEILDDPSKNTRETLIKLASIFLQKEKLYIKGGV